MIDGMFHVLTQGGEIDWDVETAPSSPAATDDPVVIVGGGGGTDIDDARGSVETFGFWVDFREEKW